MREADFQRWVIDVAKRFNWSVWHVPAPMRATSKGFVGAREAAGLPDLILIHDDPPRLVFAELKGTGGKLSVEQRDFLQAAKAVADISYDPDESKMPDIEGTLGVYVWEPGQEDSIEALLRTRVLS